MPKRQPPEPLPVKHGSAKRRPAASKGSKKHPQPLPDCDGPKLRIFPDHGSTIQWLERLDDDDDQESQACVFRARIMARDYAIKIFKFYDPTHLQRLWRPLVGNVSLETIAFYADPFFNECRAYGRIHEAIKDKRLSPGIAIPCHGYVFLRDEDTQLLKNRGVDLQLDLVDLGYQRAAKGGLRARAIIKDLAPVGPDINQKNVKSALIDILMLNREGIYNMDIRLDNFRGGKLVDFGSAQTEPHIFVQSLTGVNYDDVTVADWVDFSRMAREGSLRIPKAIGPPHIMMLRKRKSVKELSGNV